MRRGGLRQTLRSNGPALVPKPELSLTADAPHWKQEAHQTSTLKTASVVVRVGRPPVSPVTSPTVTIPNASTSRGPASARTSITSPETSRTDHVLRSQSVVNGGRSSSTAHINTERCCAAARGVLLVDIAKSVLEKLGTTESTTLAFKHEDGGKIRVGSLLWSEPKVIFRGEVLEVCNSMSRSPVSAKTSNSWLSTSRIRQSARSRSPDADARTSGSTGSTARGLRRNVCSVRLKIG
jgi:hypothetical protein